MGRAQENLIHDFTVGPVLPALLRFTLPLFLSNLLQAVYNLVDMVVVGQVVGAPGLSGISVGGDVLALLTFLSMGFSDAGQVIISMYLGAGRREKLSRFIGTMSSFLLLCAVGMSALFLVLRRPVLRMLNTPAQSWDQAMAYATVCMLGLVFIYGYNIVSAILRGLGDSKRPFLFIAVAAVLNVLLDLLFVVAFRWEAMGAALATVIAQAVSFLTALLYLCKNRARLGFAVTARSFVIDRRELLTLIKLGVPFAIRQASVLISKFFVNYWINGYGVTVSAVSGIGYKLDVIGNLVGGAVTTAGSSMVGQNLGAARYDRVKRVLGSALLVNGVFYTLMIAVFALFPRFLFGCFTGDQAVLAVCMEYLPYLLVIYLASALRNSMHAFTFGCGNSKFNFCAAVLDAFVVRVGLSLLLGLALGMGYRGFWAGSAAAGFVPFLLGGVYYLSGRWKKQSSCCAN
jgi:putative MATE family efflux protein